MLLWVLTIIPRGLPSYKGGIVLDENNSFFVALNSFWCFLMVFLFCQGFLVQIFNIVEALRRPDRGEKTKGR